MTRRATTNTQSPPQFVPTTTYGAVLGAVLAHQRKARGSTQADVAAAIGVTQATYSRLERGAAGMTVVQLAQVASALRVGPDELLRQCAAAIKAAQSRGTRVTYDRPSTTDPALVLLGGAALALLVAAAAGK